MVVTGDGCCPAGVLDPTAVLTTSVVRDTGATLSVAESSAVPRMEATVTVPALVEGVAEVAKARVPVGPAAAAEPTPDVDVADDEVAVAVVKVTPVTADVASTLNAAGVVASFEIGAGGVEATAVCS